MDRLLRRRLDAIARDRRSGAAELALRAVTALRAWLRRHRKPSEADLEEIARTLLRAQPSMAPLLRLANEVARAADSAHPFGALARASAGFARCLRSGPAQIAKHFGGALARGHHGALLTYSYSSTVLQALIRARPLLIRSRPPTKWLVCAEGRPGYEGRTTARRLAKAGFWVAIATDVGILAWVRSSRGVVVGADAVFPGGVVNKIGTSALVRAAREAKRRVWVLVDTTKFLPAKLWQTFLSRPRPGPPEEVWKRPPKGVHPFNPYFDFTPLPKGARVISERGPMTPAQVRRELRKIPVSPRLKELATSND